MPQFKLFIPDNIGAFFAYTIGPFGRNPRMSKKIAEVARKMSNFCTEFPPLKLNCCVISIKVLVQAENIQRSPDVHPFYLIMKFCDDKSKI